VPTAIQVDGLSKHFKCKGSGVVTALDNLELIRTHG
jgi:hypothetical protein